MLFAKFCSFRVIVDRYCQYPSFITISITKPDMKIFIHPAPYDTTFTTIQNGIHMRMSVLEKKINELIYKNELFIVNIRTKTLFAILYLNKLLGIKKLFIGYIVLMTYRNKCLGLFSAVKLIFAFIQLIF